MRYYDIKIFAPTGTDPVKQFTSFPGGQNDPGALNILFDAYVVAFAQPAAQSILQIWGVSLADISQASNLTGYRIEIYGGFTAGLPLNNPQQNGLLLAGKIYQCFGNWQGTEMTLDFVITGNGFVADPATSLSFAWFAGTPLATALATTLKNAFPTVKQTINISPKVVVNHDEWGSYTSLVAFAQMLKPLTQEAVGGTYPGVDIVLTPNGFSAFDGTTTTTPVAIAFQDLIGQPTWIEPPVLQFMTPMRADLTVGMFITMPKGLLGNQTQPFGAPGAVTTTTASQPQARQNSAFSGTFQVTQVHHMGNFRQPDGQSWATVINATLQASGNASQTARVA